MSAAMYQEQDLFAENISATLVEHDLLCGADPKAFKRFLRGW